MAVKLKPLSEQVMVITGATSGIGLCTARMAAKRGARLVLAARNQDALGKLCHELSTASTQCYYVVADVGKLDDVRRIASEALGAFGSFDTWVNNAAISIYGRLEDIPIEDQRQLFETNFWGLVYGSLIAARTLKIHGGALINLGSTLSDRAIPLQGIYCASKHAVKGYTDAFRMELEAEDAPVSVSLIKPAAIDTPYKDHARNYLDIEPENPPPVYAPDAVAQAILYCAENTVRDVFVGGAAKAHSLAGKFAPRTFDKVMESTMLGQTRSGEPAEPHPMEGLYETHDDRLRERGDYRWPVLESSLYTKASLHPVVTTAVTAGAAIALGSLAYRFFRNDIRAKNGYE
jgi:short-subunit dehydrogenase